MRDLGSGSAVYADADRKPCGEDVFLLRSRPCHGMFRSGGTSMP